SRSNKQYSISSSPDDLFMLDIEVAVAKKMSSDISRKTKMGQVEKAEQGIYPTVAPIGYKNNTSTHLIEVDLERAPHVRNAFALMATGNYSIEMIAEALFRDGLRSKKGNEFSKSSVHRTLHNPFYYGVFHLYGRTFQGIHEPLISKRLFDDVQAVMHGKDRVQPYIQRRGFAFSNLAACGNCGCKVLGEIKKERYIYYHCSYSKGRQENCTGYLTESRLVDLFAEPVIQVTLPDAFVEWLRRHLKDFSQEIDMIRDNRIKTLKQEYTRANERLNRLLDLRLDNEINDEAYRSRKTELEANLVNLKSQMRDAEKVNPNFYEDGVSTLERAKSFYPQYLSGKVDKKVEILKTIASNYSLTDVSATATYRKPFGDLAKGLVCSNWGE
ncbi:MAG: recombinase family protein, partial [Candidatus Omnitrophica bacterium]|nr:recombinase family protein [Candidatus Omnitrophota bacterium]